MKLISILLFSFLLASCSCEETEKPNYTKKEMMGWAYEADPNMKIELSTSLASALVDCRTYTPRCRIGYRVVLKGLKFNALYYEKQVPALEAAKRLRAYYARNWVFEEVKGEPILERIVIKYFKAQKAF